MKIEAFFSELKRRNVLRAGTFYIAAVWALAQGMAQLLPVFDAPNWITQWFLVASVIGFLPWVIFAWFYEFTPTGLKLESQIAPGESIQEHVGKRADRVIIAVLSVAVVLLLTNQFVSHRDAGHAEVIDAKAVAAVLAKVPEESVAVLPLANESGNPAQQYFSDGLSEALISELTQIEGLKVIGKYSSFKFRDSRDSPAQIGAALEVANLIQGSVFQQGNKIRVTVSMIHAEDGANVWSHSYDEELKDVFAIQSKIGQAVASALKIKLLGKAVVASDRPPSGNVEAYQLMQGRILARRGTESDTGQAIALFQRALKLDPDYAFVWGLLSNAFINQGQGFLTGNARQQAYAQARLAADKEQVLAPNAAFTHTDRGYLRLIVDNDAGGALAEFKRAHELEPNDARTMNYLAVGLSNIGQLQAAVDLFHKTIATDPLRAGFYTSLANALLGQRHLDAAEQAIRKALVLQPDYPVAYTLLAEVGILRGDAVAAQRDAKQETDPVYGPWIQAMALQIGTDRKRADAALREYIAKNGKDQPYLVADLYALRKQPDQLFEWLQRAWAANDPSINLLTDPFVLAYQHDPRFAALCKAGGLPLPSESPVSAGQH
ncbi:hypothetical protein [Rhodanobacter lindaniclasticus]